MKNIVMTIFQRIIFDIFIFPQIKDKMELINAQKSSIITCKKCNIGFHTEYRYNNHLLTAYHLKGINGNIDGNIEEFISEQNSSYSKYYCFICKVDCHKKNNYEIHLETKKHKNNEAGKQGKEYKCEDCDLNFANKQSLQKHLMSPKHLKHMKNILQEVEKDCQCIHCGKEYKSRSGLWKHIQKIHEKKEEELGDEHSKEPVQNLSNILTPELVLFLIQQNKEMQQMMMEQTKTLVTEQNKSMMETMVELIKNVSTGK
jgi:hypothetical protein